MLAKRRVLLVALAIVALALSGCKIRQDVAFNEDGSGTFTYLVGVDKDVLDDLGVEDPYEGVRKQVEEGDVSVELERYETADLKGFQLAFEFTSVDDLKKKLNVGGEGQEGQQTIQVMDLERGEERWTLTGEVGAPNLGADAGGELPIDVSELQEKLDMEFTIAMPGRFEDSNADSVRRGEDSTTFVWELAPGVSGHELFAVTDASSDGAAVWLIVGAGLGTLLLLAAIWALLRRRQPAPALQQ